MSNVILFKSESDGPDKFLKVLENSQFSGRSINCLSFQFKNIVELTEKLKTPDDYEGIIFTSPRAVKALEEVEKDVLERWKTKSDYSVGEATSLLSENILGIPTKGQESGNAQKLSEIIIKDYKDKTSKKFLCPSGNLRLGILERNLNENSIFIEYVEVYETIPHPNLESSIENLKNEKIDYFVFFSPSGVDFSLQFLKKHTIDLDSIKLIAIGPSTSRSLKENELKCFAECSKPTPESLLNSLLNASLLSDFENEEKQCSASSQT
jgi:uroporphyrinogen-III synthase